MSNQSEKFDSKELLQQFEAFLTSQGHSNLNNRNPQLRPKVNQTEKFLQELEIRQIIEEHQKH